MSRVNPWALPREPLPSAVGTFPDGNGGEFTIRLRGLNGLELTQASYRGGQYVADYVEPPEGKERLSLGGPNGEILTLDEPIARLIAQLQLMQEPDPGEEPYALHEWYAFGLHRPDVWVWAVGTSNELVVASQERLKNSLAAPAELSSAPRSKSDSAITLTSSPMS